MKLNRTLMLCIALVLSLAMVMTGTLAYLSDTDSDVNVMTLGNVSIDQFEKERADDGKLQDFTNNEKPLMPAVYSGDPAANQTQSWETIGNNSSDMLYGNVSNAVDKFVFVKNDGKSNAFFRTWIAVESPAELAADMIHLHRNMDDYTWTDQGIISVEGAQYQVYLATYNTVLTPDEVSAPSLLQVWLAPEADNDDVALFGNDFRVLVCSQAVQEQGFTNAATALEAGFGSTAPWKDATPPIDLGDDIQFMSGTLEPFTIKGSGTVSMTDVSVTAENGNAVTVEAGANVKLIMNGTNTLLGGKDGAGILVEEGAKVEITGDTLIAKGGAQDDSANTTKNLGHGIGGAGDIYIHDLNNLTAEGYGLHSFGIGGSTDSIIIENTNINYVRGGYPQQKFISDSSYGKTEPEGGAAIGSSTNGAVITLNKVNITKAEGGSKAAGIGAKFWTGVTINITNSTISEVIGGNASAGIGGSRVSGAPSSLEDITINIADSIINATGGQFAAGIGSGYDTHCTLVDKAPLCTINISGTSKITAQGGKYGAGIGTGYHTARLAGKIEESVVVNATAGESREKYTVAQNVGFGVVDHAREAKDNSSFILYKGSTISIPEAR